MPLYEALHPGCLKACPGRYTNLFYQALAKLTRGNSISFLFFRQSGATVAKTRVFCYNHVIRQGTDSYRPSDTMELNSAEIVRERKDIYENSSNI